MRCFGLNRCQCNCTLISNGMVTVYEVFWKKVPGIFVGRSSDVDWICVKEFGSGLCGR